MISQGLFASNNFRGFGNLILLCKGRDEEYQRQELTIAGVLILVRYLGKGAPSSVLSGDK